MNRVHWRCVYLALGSNLEQPVEQLRTALAALRARPTLRIFAVSSFVTSAPADASDQPWYVNAVLAGLTVEPAGDLLRACREIELAQGRDPAAPRWSARTLDIDIISLGDLVQDAAHLTLPHPRIRERAFVLQPLAEIAPHADLPGLGRVAALAAALGGPRLERVAVSGNEAAA